jgi:hypothetical protein
VVNFAKPRGSRLELRTNLEAADCDFGRPGRHVGPHNLFNVIKSVEIGRKPCVFVSFGATGSFHYQVKAI